MKRFFGRKLILSVGLCVLLLFLWQLVQAPWFFSVDVVHIKGSSFLSTQDVLDVAGVKYGNGLLKLRPRLVEDKLLQCPWIEAARVKRQLPDTLVIELVERTAVGVIPYCNSFLIVSQDGTIVDLEDDFSTINLPVVTGLDISDLKVGDTVSANGRWDSISICLKHLSESFMWQLSEISLINNTMCLYTLNGMKVELGPTDGMAWEKLSQLPSILASLTEDDEGYIDFTATYAVLRSYSNTGKTLKSKS